MNKSKIFIILLIIAVLCFGIWYFVFRDTQEEIIEYTPQEEISEEQERQALVTLYFRNKETYALMPEVRMINVKLLLENPYQTLIGLLLEGPKNEKLENPIPEGTKLNKAELQGDMVIVDLSEEFVKDTTIGLEQERKIVYSIVNTLTELTEVTSVKFLINGEQNLQFEDGELNFKEPFARLK